VARNEALGLLFQIRTVRRLYSNVYSNEPLQNGLENGLEMGQVLVIGKHCKKG
jgi:hypothetical protein